MPRAAAQIAEPAFAPPTLAGSAVYPDRPPQQYYRESFTTATGPGPLAGRLADVDGTRNLALAHIP
jgi:hypothetical protein